MIEDPKWGYLPMYDPDLMTLFNPEQRELAARAMTNDKTDFPDLVCVQEVESCLPSDGSTRTTCNVSTATRS